MTQPAEKKNLTETCRITIFLFLHILECIPQTVDACQIRRCKQKLKKQAENGIGSHGGRLRTDAARTMQLLSQERRLLLRAHGSRILSSALTSYVCSQSIAHFLTKLQRPRLPVVSSVSEKSLVNEFFVFSQGRAICGCLKCFLIGHISTKICSSFAFFLT